MTHSVIYKENVALARVTVQMMKKNSVALIMEVWVHVLQIQKMSLDLDTRTMLHVCIFDCLRLVTILCRKNRNRQTI